MSVPLLIAVTGAREAPLVAGLEQVAEDVRVVRRCADLAELLSAAQAGLGRAAVLSGDLHRLDREAVVALRQAGVAAVGLSDPDDAAAAARLRDLGLSVVLPTDAPASDVALAVLDAVRELAAQDARATEDARAAAEVVPPTGPAGGRVRGRRATYAAPLAQSPARSAIRAGDKPIADPADALSAAPRRRSDAVGVRTTPRQRPGQLIAVWGPTGAPGRTTVAINLAGELAARAEQTLLVDADTYGASVAQALGLLDESGGIAGAVRAANQGGLDVPRLARLAPSISDALRILTGLPQPARWPELRPSGLGVLWERARELVRWTVVDCGFGLEADEELSFDTVAPRRNAATLSALTAADAVVAVGSADPIGLQRLVRGLSEIDDLLGPAARPVVVLTKVRSAAVGPDPGRRVVEALARYAGVDDPVLIPDDRPGCDAAMLAGRMLIETAPNSPARLALADLAARLHAAAGRQQDLGHRAAQPA